MHRRVIGILVVTTLLGLADVGRADAILDWNEILRQAVRVDKTSPPKSSRAMALVNVAMYDAVNGILGGYEPFHVIEDGPVGASAPAAAATAAHDVLSALYPAQVASLDAAYAASLAAIADGSAKSDGVAWGEHVAHAILELRAHDHSGDAAAWESPLGAGWWQATPPAFAPPLLPNWPHVTPWTMQSGSQFRQGAPPSPNSGECTAAFQEVKDLGRVDSSSRTAEQTQTALFWADGGGTETPPGHWLSIAASISIDHGLHLDQNARLFALLSLSLADAAIVSWDHKYAYNSWRPVTAITHADDDGNPATEADVRWLPLLGTPPFPSYSSGHSTFSGSASRLIAHFLGSDDIPFGVESDGLPGVTRQFQSLSQAAEEAGQSRIYGGIHWQFDNQVGLASGRALADHVFFNYLTPVSAPSACLASATTLCLNEGRFEVQATWRKDGAASAAHAVADGGDSGSFWFFDEDNTELVVKVLDACALYDRYWVFASGLTNVEVAISVTDTQTGETQRYFNPLGEAFGPVQDVHAFATCP